jgi:hypothetical protein
MKWIKNRVRFLTEEAKIKDVILPRQAKEVVSTWGEEFLNLEETYPTENIKQGKWKISDDDKMEALGIFFGVDLTKIYSFFNNLPDKFNDVLNQSIDLNLLKSDNKWSKLLKDFNIKKPTVNQISSLNDPIFRKISVSETIATEVIVRDESGRPIMENGRPKKRKREEGEILFTNNLVNINGFVSDFNRIFTGDVVDANAFSSGDIQQLVSSSKEDFSGENYKVEVDVYGKDLYLKIDHNPKDILNISISKFYTSCQHLYTGGYKNRLLGNVFDPNTIPAFLIFDSPIYDRKDELVSEQLPLSRMMIRNMETLDNTDKNIRIFFDRSYPDRMKDFMDKIVPKYSNNEQAQTSTSTRYIYSPDIPENLNVSDPYMDRLGLTKINYIGINTNKLYLSSSYDWSKTKISPKAAIKELVIETTKVPDNLFEIPLNPEWVKIKFIKINSFSVFKKIKTDCFAFDKCKVDSNIIKEISEYNPNLKRLQFIACDIDDSGVFIQSITDSFKYLEELHLIYTIEDDKLSLIKDMLNSKNLKKISISSDLIISSDNKKLINEIKNKGVMVTITGPKI